MQNHYEILNVPEDASAMVIKLAYRRLARQHHTDRGGDKALIQKINEAYEVLFDPARRAEYDKDYEAFQASGEDNSPVEIAGLIAASGELYSESYKLQHRKNVEEYRVTPLNSGGTTHFFEAFTAISVGPIDLAEVPTHARALSPAIAVEIFINFIRGAYQGSVSRLREYAAVEVAKKVGRTAAENLLYEAIFRTILTPSFRRKEVLLPALEKITEYAKSEIDSSTSVIAHLFQNKYFRNLFSEVLHLNWQANAAGLVAPLELAELKSFDGLAETAEALAKLQATISGSAARIEAQSRNKVRLLKLLRQFEEGKQLEPLTTALDYRERAFYILDWMPTFIAVSTQAILVNTLLQAGLYFQYAAVLEPDSVIQMADESLALEVFTAAMYSSRHGTPELELYVRMHTLHYISAFRFQSPELGQTIKDFQHRVLAMANLFPLLEMPKSNISFAEHSSPSLLLMRQLLHHFVDIIEANKSRLRKIPMDHDPTVVFYQAYEACLKDWYEDFHDHSTEEGFRQRLMEALLAKNAWSELDIDRNVDSVGIMIERDRHGWIVPNRALPLPSPAEISSFQRIIGLEVNEKTGALRFSFEPWYETEPYFRRLLTPYDFLELMERSVESAFFSLDGVDPDMHFHPFNKMRFLPTALYETQLLRDLLVADYLLKFFTVGREVEGKPPYDMRTLDSLLKLLPRHLRRVIDNFHKTQAKESAQRFWIEAGKVPVAQTNVNGLRRIALGGLNMELRTHKLVLDERGNLVDGSERDEGWDIYVLTAEQKQEVVTGVRRITGPAIILIGGTSKSYFIEKNMNSLSSELDIVDLAPLMRQLVWEIDELGKLRRSRENARVYYEVVEAMTRFTDRPHHFSPEYVFAREFTDRYDEFAMFFPVFGRIRELAKIMLVVEYMRDIKRNNNARVSFFTAQLNDEPAWAARQAVITAAISRQRTRYQETFNQSRADLLTRIHAAFAEARVIIAEFRTALHAELTEHLRKIGPIPISIFSPEVKDLCDRTYRLNEEKITREEGREVWEHSKAYIRSQIEAARDRYATEITEAKKEHWTKQLYEFYRSDLVASMGDAAFREAIANYLARDYRSLLFNALMEAKTNKVKEELRSGISFATMDDINAYFRGDSAGILAKVQAHTESRLTSFRVSIDEEVARLSAIIAQEKDSLREALVPEQSLKAELAQLGLPDPEEVEINLEGKCLWVPSSVYHEVEKGHSHFVYGGVDLSPEVRELAVDNPSHAALMKRAFDQPGLALLSSQVLTAEKRHIAPIKGADIKTSNRIIENLVIRRKMQQAAEDARARGVDADAIIDYTFRTGKLIPKSTSGVGTAHSASAAPAAAAGGAGGGGSGGADGGEGRGRSGRAGAGAGGRRPPSPPDESGRGRSRREAGAGAGAGASGGASGSHDGSHRYRYRSPSDYSDSDDGVGSAAAGASAARSAAAGAGASRPRSLSPMSKMFSDPPGAEEQAEAARLRSLPSHLRPPSPGLFGGKPFGFELEKKHPLEDWTPEQVLRKVNELGLKTPRDQLILWSGLGGGDEGVRLSKEYARINGGVTLEMTEGGKWLEKMDLFGIHSPFTRVVAREIWSKASILMIQQASGQVRSLVGTIDPSSIYRIEKVELLVNVKVSGLDELNLRPRYGFQ